MNRYAAILFALAAIAGWKGYQKFLRPRLHPVKAPVVHTFAEQESAAQAAGFDLGAPVSVHGPIHPAVGMLIAEFKVRGFRNVRHESLTQLKYEPGGLWMRMEKDGVVKPGETPSLPAAEIGGVFLPVAALKERLKQIPVMREKPSPYVAVYGTMVCGYTTKALAELRGKGVPHEFRDLNDPSLQGEYMGRIIAGGIADGFSLPVIDVNGKFLERPPSSLVMKLYTAGPDP